MHTGRSMVVRHVLMVHTCSFMYTGHTDMMPTPGLLMSWEHSVSVPGFKRMLPGP